MQKQNAQIQNEEQAMEAIVRIAEANPKAVSKDIDAILEDGMVVCDTVWAGYLADAVADELGDLYTEAADLLDTAIVDYYIDQAADLFEEYDY